MANHHADAHTAGDAVHNATTLTHNHMDPGESFLGVHNNEEAHKYTDKVHDHADHNNGNRHHHNRTHANHHADSLDTKDAAYNATTATHDHTDLKESFLGVNGDGEEHGHRDDGGDKDAERSALSSGFLSLNIVVILMALTGVLLHLVASAGKGVSLQKR